MADDTGESTFPPVVLSLYFIGHRAVIPVSIATWVCLFDSGGRSDDLHAARSVYPLNVYK
jgi:hypothetical protein